MANYNYDELRNNLKAACCSPYYTDEAYDVVDALIDELEDGNETDIQDLLLELCDNRCIYYSDAFDYLKHCNVNDFQEAFENGYTGICQIMFYYLEQECYEILYKIGLDY